MPPCVPNAVMTLPIEAWNDVLLSASQADICSLIASKGLHNCYQVKPSCLRGSSAKGQRHLGPRIPQDAS